MPLSYQHSQVSLHCLLECLLLYAVIAVPYFCRQFLRPAMHCSSVCSLFTELKVHAAPHTVFLDAALTIRAAV
jgi:hypothetical protein